MHNRASYYEKDLLSYTYLVLKSNPSQSPRKIALKDKDVVKFGEYRIMTRQMGRTKKAS